MAQRANTPGALPIYQQVSELLIREIAAGRLLDGQRLPPERAMAAEHGVTVRTLRKALAELLEAGTPRWDAIALDVDNGPEGLTQDENDWLYSNAGLAAIRGSLRPGGCVGFWSAVPDRAFGKRLQRLGFRTEERRVFAHGKKGPRHTLWFGA